MTRNRARLGARLARAGGQVAYELLKSTQAKIPDHRPDTASPRRTQIRARKPFKAVARVRIPLGPPVKTQVSDVRWFRLLMRRSHHVSVRLVDVGVTEDGPGLHRRLAANAYDPDHAVPVAVGVDSATEIVVTALLEPAHHLVSVVDI